MTNKTDRFLVMSEAEFEAALQAKFVFALNDADDEVLYEESVKAEAACRARPVPEWSTHICRLEATEEFGGWNVIQLINLPKVKK